MIAYKESDSCPSIHPFHQVRRVTCQISRIWWRISRISKQRQFPRQSLHCQTFVQRPLCFSKLLGEALATSTLCNAIVVRHNWCSRLSSSVGFKPLFVQQKGKRWEYYHHIAFSSPVAPIAPRFVPWQHICARCHKPNQPTKKVYFMHLLLAFRRYLSSSRWKR